MQSGYCYLSPTDRQIETVLWENINTLQSEPGFFTCNPSSLHIHPPCAHWNTKVVLGAVAGCFQQGELFSPCGTYPAPEPALLEYSAWFRARSLFLQCLILIEPHYK